MQVKLHYRVFISNVQRQSEQVTQGEKEYSGFCTNAKPLSSKVKTSLVLTQPGLLRAPCTLREEDEQGHTRLCGLGSGPTKGRMGGCDHKRTLTKSHPGRHDDVMAMPTHGSRFEISGYVKEAAACCRWNSIPH